MLHLLKSSGRSLIAGPLVGAILAIAALAASANAQAPSAPRVTQVRALSPNQVFLQWTASTNVSSYTIYGSTPTFCFLPITVNSNVTQFTATGMPAGTQLTFVIQANGPRGIARSAPVTVFTPVPAPEDFLTAGGATERALILGVDLSRWRQAADGTTYCNFALVAITTQLGTPVPQRLATDQIDWLANPANGWTAVANGRQAQALVNQGAYTVVATYRNPGNSHVGTVTPYAWNGNFSDAVGPKISQAGILTGYDFNANVVFGAAGFPNIRYYAKRR